MRQHELAPPPGSKHRRKRVGRGDGSGHGTYSGRGLKGQKARSGGGVRPGFEGGQNPLIKSLPRKRGFTNIFRTEYSTINVARLSMFEPGTEVTPELMVERRLVKNLKRPIKVLGDGEVRGPLVVRANRFTTAAREKIEAGGGRAEEIG
ncbi:MAG: 50S ribosomal protein L15 [Dehalococcoidia bacterium]